MEEETKYAINWDAPLSQEDWEKVGKAGVYPQHLFKVSDEALSKYYQAAKSLLDDKNWNEARDSFLFLTFLNPDYPSFWIGLGIVEQSTNNFGAAVAAYIMAAAMDPSNPVPFANSFQCFLALEDRHHADLMYTQAIEACQNNPEHDSIRSRLTELKQKLKTKK